METQARRLHGAQQPGLLQNIHRVGQQALADDETRKMLLFEYADIETLLVQQGCRHGAGRPCADNHNIVDKCSHNVPLFVKLRNFLFVYSRYCNDSAVF